MLRKTALLFVLCLSMALAAGGARAGETGKEGEIAPQSLAGALKEFATRTGLQVVYGAELARGMESQGAPAGLSIDETLRELLRGTGLEFEFVAERTVAIREKNKSAAGLMRETLHLARAQAIAEQSSQAAATNAPPQDSQNAAPAARDKLDEIIVTAQKREQRILDVPMSVSALSGDALERNGIRSMADLAGVVPDLSVSEYGQYQKPLIRGIGNGQGSSSLVGIYLDEAAVTGGSSAQVDLRVMDLERVEVLRGPQGTLYGEGSTSGTIRFITRDPDLTSVGGNTDVSVYNTARGGWSEEIVGVVNVPVVQDVFGLRFAGTYENRSGWIDSPVAGRSDINDSELLNVRMKALWRPSEALSIGAMAIVHRNEGGGYNFINTGARDESLFIPRVDPLAETPYSDDYEIYNLTARYDFGPAQLLVSSAYTNMDRSFIDATRSYHFAPATVAPLDYFIDGGLAFRTITHEVRLSATGERLNWTVGAYYRDFEDSIGQRLDFARSGVRLGSVVAGLQSTSQSWALFGDASYKVTDRFEAGVGLRYFEDDRDQTNPQTGFKQANTFDSLSPRVYLSYAVTQDAKVYASAAKGFRSGGFNTGNLGGAPVKPYEPETLWSYEVGSKMELAGGRLRTEIALYYSDYQNMQTYGLPATGSFVGSFVSNVGKAEIKGIDGELSWRATDRLTLGLGGNVLEGEVAELGATAATRQTDPGDPLDNVPDYQYYVSADYGFDWKGGVPGYFRANYNRQARTTSILRNTGLVDPIGISDEIGLMNVGLGASWNRWNFEVFSNNLLDEAGRLTPYQWASIDAQPRPRTVGVRVHYDFR